MKNKDYDTVLSWNYIIISLIFISVFTMLVLYLPNMREIDVNILNAVTQALAPYPAYIPKFITNFGWEYFMLWPQIAAGSVLVSHRKYAKAFWLIALTQLSFFINNIVKNFVCRERPCGDAYPGFSFPSNHMFATVTFYGIVIYLIVRYTQRGFWRYFLVTIISLFIFMCGLSRMWLGVHYLSDVLAGAFMGLLMVNLYIIITRKLTK